MNVKLVKFSKKYLTKNYINSLNDKNIVKYSNLRLQKNSIKKTDIYLKYMSRKRNLFYAIIDKYQNSHVGNISAYIDYYNSIADIAIIIFEPRKSYGSQSWALMIKKLFNLKIRKITAGCMIENKNMIKIFKKSRMKFEYLKKKHFRFGRRYIDLVGYSLFR
jgi:RimJ/RimL family protein N-acetyltransferase